MGESGKSVLALLMIIGILGGIMAWMIDGAPWTALAGFPALAVGSLGALLWALARKDKVPDLPRRQCGTYYERDGFCFAIVATSEDGRARLDVYFQNRFENPCQAQVVIRPSQQFLMNRRPIEMVTVEILCEGAAFGVARVPWAVPSRYQGKKQAFDLAASVAYPAGRGAMVRYRDGLRVGKAGNRLWTGILTLAAAAGGMVVITKPAKVKVQLPRGVAEDVPEDALIRVETLWSPAGAAEMVGPAR